MELVRGRDFRSYVENPERRVDSSPPATAIVAAGGGPDRETVRPPADEGRPEVRRRATSPARMDRLRSALRQLVAGLHALHADGKLHRDIKPSNVLVSDEGRVVLLDFGVAAELKTDPREVADGSGELVGTLRYMAPEQGDDMPLTPASDWYSVGVVLYEALVGRAPFVGAAAEVLMMKSNVDPIPPSECVGGVPPDLDALCRALLEREPSMRPSGDEVLRRLGLRRSSAPPPALAESPDAAAAFVGRESALRALRDAFDAAQSGTVTVRISGAAGMGKSALAHHALDELANRGALVLRGRVYERESVPYKAVDSLIDALSRHLIRRADDDARVPPPADAGALGRLFPVLRRVPGFDRPVEQGPDDLQTLRRRAFVALRELLATLIAQHPLVIFVDDAQWGDVDSVALLVELLRPPQAPPMLLVMTYRDEAVATSPFLAEMRERWPEGADARDIAVGPLTPEDATQLALTLLGASDEATERTADAIARESGGNPFLVEELVRGHVGVTAPAEVAAITLERLVGKRLDRLPNDARRLIEIVAVGGRPLPVSVVARASGLHGRADETLILLGARRFARTGWRNGHEVIEPIHDRIRETIVAQLQPAALRDHHWSLAQALEDSPTVDAEAIATHWLGAGDPPRAARFAQVAAEEACTQLAFDQAARLFRFALEHLAPSSPQESRVRLRLAQALELGGRAVESARTYLACVDGASPTEQVEYRRAAAEQLLAAGHIGEGETILRGVLAAVGMGAPRSPIAALFWLVVYRVWIALRGLRFEERTADAVPREDRLRVDALCTVASGLGTVNIILGACMQARHFMEAIRKGDRFQLLRAVSIEVAQLMSAGKAPAPREHGLVELGRGLVERVGSAEASAYFHGIVGVGLMMRGLWREGRTELERAGSSITGINAARQRLFLARAYFFMGDPKECARRETHLYAEAEDRGDLFTTVGIRTSTHVRKWLAAGQPMCARRDLEAALAQWPHSGFLVQHWQAMIYAPDIDLYVGDGAAAYERFMRDMPKLKRSLLLHAGFARALTFYTHGRLAIASIESNSALRRARIAEALGMSRRLQREAAPWTAMLAALVEAIARNADGDRAASIAALRVAIERGHATDTMSYVPAAQYRLGELLGGEEGRALTNAAIETMWEWGVQEPTRLMAVYMPGVWTHAQRGARGSS
jgi:eukaryotic-like serine/threonine-protein kinase